MNEEVMLDVDAFQRAMKARGLNARELAEEAGVSYELVYKLSTRGGPNVSAAHLARIAKCLGVSVNYLLSLPEDEQIVLEPELIEPVRRMNAMSPHTRSFLADVIARFLDWWHVESTAPENLVPSLDLTPREQKWREQIDSLDDDLVEELQEYMGEVMRMRREAQAKQNRKGSDRASHGGAATN